MPLTKFPSMNIGIYSNEIIKRNKGFILSQKNTDYSVEQIQKVKKNAVETEDFLFKTSTKVKTINYHLRHLSSRKVVNYGSGTRLLEYYSQLGLYKYKANFELKDIYIVDL